MKNLSNNRSKSYSNFSLLALRDMIVDQVLKLNFHATEILLLKLSKIDAGLAERIKKYEVNPKWCLFSIGLPVLKRDPSLTSVVKEMRRAIHFDCQLDIVDL